LAGVVGGGVVTVVRGVVTVGAVLTFVELPTKECEITIITTNAIPPLVLQLQCIEITI